MEVMKSTLAILEIRYKEPASQFLFLDSLAKAVSDKPAQGKFVVGSTFEVNLKDKRVRILVEPQRIALIMEAEKTEQELLSFYDDTLQKVLGKLSFSSVARIGMRTVWIKESGDTLDELIEKFKKAFYCDTLLLKESSDVAVPFTFKNKDAMINFTSGPMEKEQYINQYSVIKDGVGVPETFVLVDVDYSKLPDSILGKKDILKFVSEGYKFAETKNIEANKILQ